LQETLGQKENRPRFRTGGSTSFLD